MGRRIAEQIPVEEYGSQEVKSYRVPELEDNNLSGLVFNLPAAPSRFSTQPVLCVYAGDDLTGYFFRGESFQQDTLFGLEGPEEAEALESGEYSAREIDPFLGRHDHLNKGFRHYKIPVHDNYSYEVVADVRPDEREQEKILFDSFEEGTPVSQLLIGRTEDGWDFLSGKSQEVSKEVE